MKRADVPGVDVLGNATHTDTIAPANAIRITVVPVQVPKQFVPISEIVSHAKQRTAPSAQRYVETPDYLTPALPQVA